MTEPNFELIIENLDEEFDDSFDDYPEYEVENDCVFEYESD